MSFSSGVKEELSRHQVSARHCQIAELAALITLCGGVFISEKHILRLKVQTENVFVARKCFTLLKKAFNIETDVSVRQNTFSKTSRTYTVAVAKSEDAARILKAAKLIGQDTKEEIFSAADNLVFQRACCKRSFLRGAFLAAGSISDPRKFYHFEIVCPSVQKAQQLQSIMDFFGADAKIIQRKRHFVVYLKEGEQIVDMLNVMGAHVSLMELENVRILKEMRNSVNRKVNCEAANINKTVNAALRQIEDIRYVQRKMGFEQLSDGLAQIARLRLEQPDASLKELGMMVSPPVGKSGVNHRLRKLSDLAEKLRESEEDSYYD